MRVGGVGFVVLRHHKVIVIVIVEACRPLAQKFGPWSPFAQKFGPWHSLAQKLRAWDPLPQKFRARDTFAQEL